MATAPARELKIGTIIDKSFAVIERAMAPSLIFLVSLTLVDGVIAYLTATVSPLAQLAVTPLRVVIGVFFSYQLLKAMIERTGLRSRGDGDVFLTYFGLAVLYGLAVALGLILLVLPALFLISRWCLAQPLVVARGDGVMRAFGESWQRTSGNEFPIIVVVLLFVMVPIVISVVAGVMLPKDNLIGIAIAQLATSASSLLSLAMGTALYGIVIGVPTAAATPAE
jgi:membrane-anchored glycerophosphoryl diester phosphodiesterase (GDPDase)